MTVTKTFFGIPIDGDIAYAEKRAAQRPIEDLQPLMQALLDDDGIEWFAWRQYTPYFNDGEPCVFNVHGALAVKLTDKGRILKCPHCEKERNNLHTFCPYCGFRHGVFDKMDEEAYEDVAWEGVKYSDVLGKRERLRYGSGSGPEHGEYEGPDEARYDRCLALEEALDSGAFDDVLLQHFGDHAAVKVHKDRISVETYDHD